MSADPLESLDPGAWATLVASAAQVSTARPDDTGAWLAEVQRTALELARVVARLAPTVFERERSWTGVVINVEDPARSTAGQPLTLAKVHFHSDQGRGEDYAWVDRRRDGALILAAKEAKLARAHVRYTKRHVPQMEGGRPKVNAEGRTETRPYLAALTLIDDHDAPNAHPPQSGGRQHDPVPPADPETGEILSPTGTDGAARRSSPTTSTRRATPTPRTMDQRLGALRSGIRPGGSVKARPPDPTEEF